MTLIHYHILALGANWIDEECGPVAGTTHLGIGLVSVWGGNDPMGHPDEAWKLCYEVETDARVYSFVHTKLLHTFGLTN